MKKKSANLRQKTANSTARGDIEARTANATRRRNLEGFFKGQAAWAGAKPPADQIYEETGATPDAYRFVVLVGPRGQGKGVGGGQWIEAHPADTEGWARQIAQDQPQDDPVLVLDLDSGKVVFESYPTDFYDEEGNEKEVEPHPWLNQDASDAEPPPWHS